MRTWVAVPIQRHHERRRLLVRARGVAVHVHRAHKSAPKARQVIPGVTENAIHKQWIAREVDLSPAFTLGIAHYIPDGRRLWLWLQAGGAGRSGAGWVNAGRC